MKIYPGDHIHLSAVGNLYLDRDLDPFQLGQIVRELQRRHLEPNDVVSATINGSQVDFELRQPLSD